MAGSTPIYGFPYPESSDLVANYPALGQDLAEDIETVIAALPPGGLAHVATESFSAVSRVSLNGVFTSDYQNYAIKITATNASTVRTVTFRLRNSGSDLTASNYSYGSVGKRLSDGSDLSAFATGQTSALFGYVATGYDFNGTLEIMNPLSGRAPQIQGYSVASASTGSATDQRLWGWRYSATQSYDGLSLILSGGSFTGTIRVYGYQNS